MAKCPPWIASPQKRSRTKLQLQEQVLVMTNDKDAENNSIFSEAREDSMDRARLQRFEKPQSLDIDGWDPPSHPVKSVLPNHVKSIQTIRITLCHSTSFQVIPFNCPGWPLRSRSPPCPIWNQTPTQQEGLVPISLA